MKNMKNIIKLAERDMEDYLNKTWHELQATANKGVEIIIEAANNAACIAASKVLKKAGLSFRDDYGLNVSYNVKNPKIEVAERQFKKLKSEMLEAFRKMERNMVLASSSDEAREAYNAFISSFKKV